jgi:hypothetical protein
MNLPDHASISRLIAARYPTAAVDDAILGWLRALGPTGILGVEIDDLNEEIVRGLLGGGSDDDVVRRIGEQFDGDSIGDQAADLRDHIGRVRGLPCLAPLFTGDRARRSAPDRPRSAGLGTPAIASV